jgi:tetratricopeptide (TPR) repeat protein
VIARARAFAGLRRFVQADHEYAQALRMAPDAVEIRRESHRNRGYVFAGGGDFRKSAEEFGKASALDPTDSDLWRFYAAALAASGDAAAYRQVCRDMINQFGDTTDRAQAYDVTHACVLMPDAVPEMSRLMKLAESASTWYVGAKRILGAACYRAGRYEDALSMFSGAAKGQRFRAFDMCFVAMAQQRLGNHDAARRQLDEALDWIEAADAQGADDLTGLQPHWGHWHEPMDVRRLAEEARRLIEEAPPSN